MKDRKQPDDEIVAEVLALLPQRPKEGQRPDMERINHLRDEK